jgi:hypothetical protein
MGQEAIDRGEYHGEMRITDARKFARSIGFARPFIDHLAMQRTSTLSSARSRTARRFAD